MKSKPAPEKGQNVCAFERVKKQLVLRRNATSTRNLKIVDCGIPSFPNLKCEEERYEFKGIIESFVNTYVLS